MACPWRLSWPLPGRGCCRQRRCVRAGGCTLDTADAVCGHTDLHGASVLDELTALIDSNLVRVRAPADGDDTPRVMLLETIREFGIEQLQAHGELDDTRQRHADHFVAVAEAATAELSGADAPTAAARLDAEHDNLRAALPWLCDRGDASTAVRLAGCMWPYWFQRGHLTEGRRWLHGVLDMPGADTVAARLRLAALIGAARLAMDQADHDAAETASAAAVALALAQRNPRQLVAALNVRGHITRLRDRYADSARDHDEARTLAHTAGDRAGEAEALATESLDRWRRLGDTGEVAELHFQLGNTAMFRGDHERADRSFQQALALHRDRGDVLHLSRDLSGVGAAALNLGDLDHARALISDSLDLARRYDDRWG